MSLARARTFRVLKAAMKSAKRCPSRDKQLEILYTIRHTFDNNMRNLGSLDDKKALLLIEDSEREVDMMNYYHHLRELKEDPHALPVPKLENTWISEEESPQISHIKMKSNEPVTETLSSEQKERAKPAKFCVNCGEQYLSQNERFCGDCGQPRRGMS